MRGLRRSFSGALFECGDAGYEAARKVWNGSVDRRPALIARCRTVSDVVGAVRLARDMQLDLAVRGGGHNVAGFGTCDGGIVADLSLLNYVVVDPRRRLAWAQGGVTWGAFDHETHRFGLATPGGQVSSTGIGGLTLGGGIGWLVRKYGLSCDNVVSVDLVAADGSCFRANADENADLFWGVRGGGGNFGVVTKFEYRLHPVSAVYAGLVFHPLTRADEVLRFLRDFAAEAADELSMFVVIGTPWTDGAFIRTHGVVPVISVWACYCGPSGKGINAMAQLKNFGTPMVEEFREMSYPALQRLMDAGAPSGLQNYAKAEYVTGLTDSLIDAVIRSAETIPSIQSQVIIGQLGGAMQRVAESDSAFSHRASPYVVNVLPMWNAGGVSEVHMDWAESLWDELRRCSTGGVYVNFLGVEGVDRTIAAYGEEKYACLARLKDKYDPANVFHLNQNIAPRGTREPDGRVRS